MKLICSQNRIIGTLRFLLPIRNNNSITLTGKDGRDGRDGTSGTKVGYFFC